MSHLFDMIESRGKADLVLALLMGPPFPMIFQVDYSWNTKFNCEERMLPATVPAGRLQLD